MEGGDGLLESVGGEITGIVMPVSLCMLLVVMLVRCLTPHGSEYSQSVGTLVYTEKASDSTSQKLEGSLLNSLAFVAVIAVITFLFVLLYYFRCTKLIKYYICFSVAITLSNMGGGVLVGLIKTLSIPVDIFSFVIFLLNFTVVGTIVIFLSNSVPILVTQFYLVMIGIFTAFWFSLLPEWTTWMTLATMAVYDLVAVLAPGGPLKLLVELAISRDEELPALIYETRPAVRPGQQDAELESRESADSNANQGRPRRWRLPSNQQRPARASTGPATELQPRHGMSSRSATLRENMDMERRIDRASPEGVHERMGFASERALPHETMGRDEESLPLVRHEATPPSTQIASRSGGGDVQSEHHSIEVSGEEDDELALGLSSTGGLKLGLGDFVFYSLLVGRAAMYDLTTVYACYLAIIAGLGATLILLAVARRALPALPISIGLGMIFYLLTRLLLEPLIAGLSTSLVMF